MPQVYSKRFTSPGFNITFTLFAPTCFWVADYFHTTFNDKVRFYFEVIGSRFLEGAKVLYNFEPLRSSFHTIEKIVGRSRVTIGLGTPDPIFPFIEWDTKPHFPPFQRMTQIGDSIDKRGRVRPILERTEGTGLEKWAKDRGFNPFAVAMGIARKGTRGRSSRGAGVSNLQDLLADEIEEQLIYFIEQILSD